MGVVVCLIFISNSAVGSIVDDYYYRSGKTPIGDSITREDADDRLWRCIRDRSPLPGFLKNLSPLAWFYFVGVRLFGYQSYRGNAPPTPASEDESTIQS